MFNFVLSKFTKKCKFQNNPALHPVQERNQRGEPNQAHPARSGSLEGLRHQCVVDSDLLSGFLL
jgi:hypothetical protein